MKREEIRSNGPEFWAQWHENRRLKLNCRNRTMYALKTGKLTKPDACSKCGSLEKIEAHHDDYTKSLEVRWLCFVCHRQHHTEENRRLNHVD